MTLYVGSARHDERNKYSGGQAGDSLQVTTDDYKGEVSMQKFYVHSRGWKVLRPKDIAMASKLADAMVIACNNKNIGYNQNRRLGVVSKGINTKERTDSDCSSLVRACIIYATGVDVGNFTTINEATMLEKSGLFEEAFEYTANTVLYNGDVLVTKTKGHTVIVVSGNPRNTNWEYYPKYTGTCPYIVTALQSVGEKDTSLHHRAKIAVACGVVETYSDFIGSAKQNNMLLSLLKAGKLVKV